jgi:hypothetical protein
MRELHFSLNDCIATMYDRANVSGAALNKIDDKMLLRHRPVQAQCHSNTLGRVGECFTNSIAREVRKLFTIVFGNTCLKARLLFENYFNEEAKKRKGGVQ